MKINATKHKMTTLWPLGLRYSFNGIILIAIFLVVLTLAAEFFFSESAQSILTNLFINLVAVLGMYMFIGTSGVPSFGHVAFMGIAAHLQALLTLEPTIKSMLLPNLPSWLAPVELGLWPAMLITVAFVGVFAFLIGIPFSRMGDAATGIVTICFLAIIQNVLMGWETFTAGFKVIYGIPEYCGLWTAGGLAAASILAARLFRDSAPGLELRASRDDKSAAQSIGVNVANQRLLAWVLSAMMMAVAGVLLVHFLTIVNPAQFYLGLTFSLIAMLIVGGVSTVSGAVIGTFFMTLVIEILRKIGEGPVIGPFDLPQIHGLSTMGTGAAIMAVMFWKRDGIVAFFEIDERLAAWRKHRTPGKSFRTTTVPGSDRSIGTPGNGSRQDLKHRLLIENVTKNFGGLRALDAVSLSLTQGEIVGLIGPNGSGKSTLINVICGFYLPSNGRIYMDDTDLTTWPAHQIARHGVGRTFQSIQLFSNLTVFENVLAGANIRASELDDLTPEKWTQHLINQFGLDEYADRLAATLPYGPQRSLEIARAVAIQCRFLLLDEPAAGMIRRESDQLIDVLRKIRADFGIGLLVIDHDLKMIMQLCDRVLVLNKGQMIASGSPDQVQQNPDVIEAYIGRKH